MSGMAAVLFLILAIANIPPLVATLLLVAFWLVLFVTGCRWFVAHPVRVFFLPFLGFAVWLTTILIGTNHYGWGA
jgi:hypothetical protein